MPFPLDASTDPEKFHSMLLRRLNKLILEDTHIRKRVRISSLYEEIFTISDPNDLPILVKSTNVINDIGFHIQYQEAEHHLSEFNYVQNLEDIIGKICILSYARDHRKYHILHIAIERRELSLLKLIIYFYPHLIDVVAEDDFLPLHLAALTGQEEMIDWLINPIGLIGEERMQHQNRVIDAKTKEGSTALHLALIGGHRNLARKLESYGADRNCLNLAGLTPADSAVLQLHTLNACTGLPHLLEPLQIQKYQQLIIEFAPARGTLSLEQLINSPYAKEPTFRLSQSLGV